MTTPPLRMISAACSTFSGVAGRVVSGSGSVLRDLRVVGGELCGKAPVAAVQQVGGREVEAGVYGEKLAGFVSALSGGVQ